MKLVKMNNIVAINRLPSNDSRYTMSMGKEFSDETAAKVGHRITSVKISYGELIHGIQFIYDNNLGSSKFHGSANGTIIETEFEDDEYIQKFSWKTARNNWYTNNGEGTLVFYITIETNKREYNYGVDGFKGDYTFGNEIYSISATDGYMICGIKGKAYSNSSEHKEGEKTGSCGQILDLLYSISDVYEKEICVTSSDGDIYYDDYFSAINADRITNIHLESVGNFISSIHVVYDGDETLTQRHGNISLSNDKKLTIEFDVGEYIKEVNYQTCKRDGNNMADIINYIELVTSQKRYLFGTEHNKLPSDCTNKHNFSIKAEVGYEIWAFAGLYDKSLGRFVGEYQRQLITGKQSASVTPQISCTKKKILVINNNCKNNGKGQPKEEDVAVAHLCYYWRKWYLANVKELTNACDYIPIGSESGTIFAEVKQETIQDAILRGQYNYIIVHNHGEECFIGNQSALIDTKWVLDNKKKIGEKCKNTVINFCCCECASRKTNDFYKKKGINNGKGLAVSMIEAGLGGAFGYTVALTLTDPKNIMNNISLSQEQVKLIIDWYKRLVTTTDKFVLIDKLSANSTAVETIKEFDKIKTEIKKHVASLKNGIAVGDVLLKIECEFNTEKNAAGFVESSEIFVLNKNSRYNKFESRLKNSNLSTGDKILCKVYWDIYFAREHFCGTGSDKPTKTLKDKNLGELCNEYGDLTKDKFIDL